MTDEWTIGHSTRSLDEFIAMLQGSRIEVLVDVRRFPHSRRNPHFNTDELRKSLFQAGIRYEYMGDALGGFRKHHVDSKNVGLTNDSFRGYADHMETPTFRAGLERLRALAAAHRVAYMCSESNYKSCHRRLMSDFLTLVHGDAIHHIVGAGKEIPHEPIREARVEGDGLVYAPLPLDAFGAANTNRNDTRG